jgi:hypothetical protein
MLVFFLRMVDNLGECFRGSIKTEAEKIKRIEGASE